MKGDTVSLMLNYLNIHNYFQQKLFLSKYFATGNTKQRTDGIFA